jgi:hypothetical protein
MSPVDDRDRIPLRFHTEKCAPCLELGHECWANAKVDDVPMCTFCEAGEPCLKQVKAHDDFMEPTASANGPVRHIDPSELVEREVPAAKPSWTPPGPPEKSSRKTVEKRPAVYPNAPPVESEEPMRVEAAYAPKKCRNCPNQFVPTGARAEFCDECKEERRRAAKKPKETRQAEREVSAAAVGRRKKRTVRSPKAKVDVGETLMLEITEANLDAFFMRLSVEEKLAIVQDSLRVR